MSEFLICSLVTFVVFRRLFHFAGLWISKVLCSLLIISCKFQTPFLCSPLVCIQCCWCVFFGVVSLPELHHMSFGVQCDLRIPCEKDL